MVGATLVQRCNQRVQRFSEEVQRGAIVGASKCNGRGVSRDPALLALSAVTASGLAAAEHVCEA